MTARLGRTYERPDSCVAAAPGEPRRPARSTRGVTRGFGKPGLRRDLEVESPGHAPRGGDVVSPGCYHFVTTASSARRRAARLYGLMARHQPDQESVVQGRDAARLSAETA